VAGIIKSIKKSNETIRNRTRDLPACSVVSQPTAPLRSTAVCVCVCVYIYIYVCVCVRVCGLGSSVGIATDYGLDGPGSNPGGDEIFRPSIPTLGPTQPPVQLVTGLSRG